MIEQRLVYAGTAGGGIDLDTVNRLLELGWHLKNAYPQHNGHSNSGMVFLLERVKPEAK